MRHQQFKRMHIKGHYPGCFSAQTGFLYHPPDNGLMTAMDAVKKTGGEPDRFLFTAQIRQTIIQFHYFRPVSWQMILFKGTIICANCLRSIAISCSSE